MEPISVYILAYSRALKQLLKQNLSAATLSLQNPRRFVIDFDKSENQSVMQFSFILLLCLVID